MITMTFRRELILNAAVMIVSFMVAGLILWWFRGEINFQADQVETARLTIARQAGLFGSLANLKQQVEIARGYEEKLSRLLPIKDQLINFPRWLEGLALQRQVNARFSFEGATVEATTETPGSVGFSLDLTGTLSAIQGLLRDLEVAPRAYFLKFNDFDLNRSGESYHFSAKGNLFFRLATSPSVLSK